MKKTFVTLLVSAIAVWGWVVTQFLQGYFGRNPSDAIAARQDSAPGKGWPVRALPALDTSYRDPFLSYLYTQKPVVAKPSGVTARKPALVVIEPPKAVLGGILWGDAPVAILKLDAATELVREGGEAFGLKVIRIERHQVTVTHQGRKFVLAY